MEPDQHHQQEFPESTNAQPPVAKVLRQVEVNCPTTPTRQPQQLITSPLLSSPALRRLDEHALRDRLREAYLLLKEKEQSLLLAATVGQELVDTNQQLQESYDKLQAQLQENKATEDDETLSRLHGRRRSMHQQQKETPVSATESEGDSSSEQQWLKVHVQPLKAQLELVQERNDEILAERENLAAEVYSLRQEQTLSLRRTNELTNANTSYQKQIEKLEEDKAHLQNELEELRTFWTRRWTDHQQDCRLDSQIDKDVRAQQANKMAQDAAARLRAEKRADSLQTRFEEAQAELELLRSQMERMEEERTNEWEPMRERWINCEQALQELQETHQTTCEALAQADARLAEIDGGSELNDPIKLKSDKTSISLLGELDMERHRAVSKQQELFQDHATLKRAYARSRNSQSRMKQQVARLTQLAATGASESRMRRLEAALGEAECQQQALLWANMDQRRRMPQTDDLSEDGNSSNPGNGTALVTALRAKLRYVTADRDQAQRELRTAHLLRANEIQKTRELEIEVADTESQLRRALGELSVIKADYETLKRSGGDNNERQTPPPYLEIKDEELEEPKLLPPTRKRTSSKAIAATDVDSASPPHKRTDPMSLSFVVNASAEEEKPDKIEVPASTEAVDNKPIATPIPIPASDEIYIGSHVSQKPMECNNQ